VVVSEVCGILVAMVQVVTVEMVGTVGLAALKEKACQSATAAQMVFAAKIKSEAIAALAAKEGVEVSCRGGERAAVRHRPRHPLEARPHTVV
jgi:hypothetical protein